MIVIATLLSLTVATAQSRVEADATAVQRAATAVAPHLSEDETSLDGKPGTARLVEAQWRAVQRWAADWLDTHPGADPKALEKAGARLGQGWQTSAVGLGGRDIAVAASHGQMGTVFILGREGRSGYRVRWSVDGAQRSLDPKADRALALWRSTVQNGRCRDGCRIPSGGVRRLPDSVDGARRFAVEASYAQSMGATMNKQLSLWSWRNGQARPLVVREFSFTLFQAGTVLRGSTLHVRAKGDWKSLSPCGMCGGRETDLRFAIAPSGVRALPPLSLTPEIDVVDLVYWRVLMGRPVEALASRSALKVIRAQLADRLAETDPELRSYAGMPMGWRRWTSHGMHSACLAVDGVGATAFAFDGKRRRITAARALDPNSCQGKGTRS